MISSWFTQSELRFGCLHKVKLTVPSFRRGNLTIDVTFFYGIRALKVDDIPGKQNEERKQSKEFAHLVAAVLKNK